MAYSKRNGVDKALDQVDRVLENLGQKQKERKIQENKSVQCHSFQNIEQKQNKQKIQENISVKSHSTENKSRNKNVTTKENVKKSKVHRGVLLPKRVIKPGQVKKDPSSRRSNRKVEDSTNDLLSSTPNRSKVTDKISHNFTSISHISKIAPQHKKKRKRKVIQIPKENSSTDEDIKRCYFQKNENYTLKKTSTKTIKKMKANSLRYIEKENEKQSNKENNALASTSSKSRVSTHAEPTQSSINRLLLTEKVQRQDNNVFPYVPVGTKSSSHNYGIKIQQDLGNLKLDPKAASIEAKYLAKQNSENNVYSGSIRNHCIRKREEKDSPQLCEDEIYRALKNINKEIAEFIVQSS